MPRAAGNSSTYELAVIDAAGNPKGRTAALWSVTTILKALPKFGLDWWGYKLGVKAMLEYLHDGADTLDDPDEMYEILKKRRVITPYTELTKAGGRGTDIHDIAEQLLTTGEMPPKTSVPEEKRAYAKALKSWYDAFAVNLETKAVEVPVFSLQYNYAGTLDAILYDSEMNVYYVIDFKTSKGIYESHHLQLAAYDYAARERGYIPRDAVSVKGVVRLGADGRYEIGVSDCTIEDFLCVMRVHELLERMKEEKPSANKKIEVPSPTPARVEASV